MCLPPPPTLRGGSEGSKDDHFQNINLYKNDKVDSLYGRTLPKIRIISKISSTPRCTEISFVSGY